MKQIDNDNTDNSNIDIDFIKWKVGYAQGYHLKFKGVINQKKVEYVDYGEDMITLKEFMSCQSMAMSLLLHKTVIGINKGTDYSIALHHSHIALFRYDDVSKNKTFEVRKDSDYEKGIERVLKYIYKQERNR